MSDDLHPDLDEFYDTVPGDEDQWEDEDDEETGAIRTRGSGPGRGYQVFVDPDDEFDDEDDDDEDYIFEDDIGEVYDDEEADPDEGEEDEDLGEGMLIDNEDDGTAGAFRELENLINAQTRGGAGLAGLGDGGDSGGSSLLQQLMNSGILRVTRGTAGEDPLSRAQRAQARQGTQRRQREPWWTPQREPHPNGKALLKGGEFGRVGQWDAGKNQYGVRRPKVNQSWMNGWSGPKLTSAHSRAIVPNTPGTIVAVYPSVPYVGQYAKEDYSLFYTATQYFTLHLYSTNQAKKNHITSNPRKRRRSRSLSVQPPPQSAPEEEEEEVVEEDDDDDDYETEESDEDDMWGRGGGGPRSSSDDSSLKRIKRVQGVEGSWTVTDCDADKKGDKMIYSSITPYVHMLYTNETDQEHIELDFTGRRRDRDAMWGYDRFGIWSIRFSADGKEVVAGAGSGRIMVYDIDAQRRTLAVQGHADDVNAVSFADESSTNILVSGSDDGYVKVWDRRSLSSSTPSGILVGATEGITYTSPKGDGRYMIVNSKDQAARLYDLRKMRSANEFDNEPDAVASHGSPRFDYRGMDYPRPSRLAHPKDCSIMTFRGHSVLRTLIRCHFSPRESTGQSYIYSGSADGLIHIWSLDGRVLNRAESLPLKQNANYSDPSMADPTLPNNSGRYQASINQGNRYASHGIGFTVRDVAWHGYEPTLMSTCWETNGHYRSGGNVAKHEWKGLGKNGLNRLEDWVEKRQSESQNDPQGGTRRMPGSVWDWDM
ncbi:uncharacterized protein I303_100091 [Kwoniella dejecticola CBS 10117]|uniref:Uncharacterized protein n=1 Tax=Kwoniella dejecticola CBS 10117 TaxID=1296121 RepID=A0A1A6ADZ1_9TREE|nr:uncharacterized protein I303_00091 [Kwoniella dejecticola CBS 10117]OBR88280.1 hypothetical protein I303_00091 [Kwoniella dejecticola CBS 10117]